MSFSAIRSFKERHEQIKVKKSPLLFNALDDLPHDRKIEVLDVGAIHKALMDYFSGRYCKLYICNCVNEIAHMEPEKYNTDTKLSRYLVKQLGLYKKEPARLDMILLWDLLDYMKPEIITGFIKYILPHSHKNLMLHAYINTAGEMPVTPSKHIILEGNEVQVILNTDEVMPSPMYYQDALHKLLAPFKVKRSILHTNGIQEYLFSLR